MTERGFQFLITNRTNLRRFTSCFHSGSMISSCRHNSATNSTIRLFSTANISRLFMTKSRDNFLTANFTALPRCASCFITENMSERIFYFHITYSTMLCFCTGCRRSGRVSFGAFQFCTANCTILRFGTSCRLAGCMPLCRFQFHMANRAGFRNGAIR